MRFIKYQCIGVMKIAITYSLYLILTSFGVYPTFSLLIIFPIGIIFSYLMKSYLLNSKSISVNFFSRYFLFSLFFFITNITLLELLIFLTNIPHQYLQFSIIITLALLSYLVNFKYIFTVR